MSLQQVSVVSALFHKVLYGDNKSIMEMRLDTWLITDRTINYERGLT